MHTLTLSFSKISPTSLHESAFLKDCSLTKSILWCNSCSCSIKLWSVTGVSQMCLHKRKQNWNETEGSYTMLNKEFLGHPVNGSLGIHLKIFLE